MGGDGLWSARPIVVGVDGCFICVLLAPGVVVVVVPGGFGNSVPGLLDG